MSRLTRLPDALIAALAVGSLTALVLVGRDVQRFWHAGEYLREELPILLPYLAYRLADPRTLLLAIGATLCAFALASLRWIRPLAKALAGLCTLVLVVNLCAAGWIAYRVRAPVDRLQSALRVSEAGFFDLFDLSRPGLRAVREAVRTRDYRVAERQLLAYFREKYRDAWTDIPDPERSAQLIAHADHTVQHIFSVYGNTRTLPADIDWEAGFQGNREWLWMLNRMGWLPTLARASRLTRDPRYAQAVTALLQDWLEDNPLPTWKNEQSPAWRLLETARRLRGSWPTTFQVLVGSPDVADADHVRMLKGLHDHAQYLAHFRSHANHLLTESVALLDASSVFPEFKRARIWRSLALHRLGAEIEKQIYPDGAHEELTPWYHVLALDTFFAPLQLSREYGFRLPDGYADRMEAMLDFVVLTQQPDGGLPLFNDTNPEDVRSLLVAPAEFFERPDLLFASTGGAEGRAPDITSGELPYTGYYIMRSDWTPEARYLIFDAGGYGGHHGHEDKLSFEMSAFGTDMVRDGGAYGYTGDPPFRAYFLSTRAHNTILLDGLGQNRHRMLRHRSPTHADHAERLQGNRWRSTREYDYATGAYTDGYSEMGSQGRGAREADTSMTHERRLLFIKPDYWIVMDKVAGPGVHEVEQLFHLTPDAEAGIIDGHVRVRYTNGAALQIMPLSAGAFEVSIVEGSTEPIQGWAATGRNQKLPAPVAVVKRTVELPVLLYTMLMPSVSSEAAPFSCSLVRAGKKPAGRPAARVDTIRVMGPAWTDELTFAYGEGWEGIASADHPRGAVTITLTRVDQAGTVTRRFSLGDQ